MQQGQTYLGEFTFINKSSWCEIETIVDKYSGTKINIDYFLDEVMDEDHLDDIFEYFKESESDDLELAINELGGDYTEEEIRLVRIKFISEMGN